MMGNCVCLLPVFVLFLFLSLVWPNLDSDVFRKEDITLFLFMLQYVCFLWRINKARWLITKLLSTVEFITTLCKLLLSLHHYLAALLFVQGHIFAHFVVFSSFYSPIKPQCFIRVTESYTQCELHLIKCVTVLLKVRLRVPLTSLNISDIRHYCVIHFCSVQSETSSAS